MILKFCYSIFLLSIAQNLLAQIEFVGLQEPIHVVNSPYDESYVSLHPNGAVMIFTREKHPQNLGGAKNPGDLWLSFNENTWSIPSNEISLQPLQFVSPLGFVNEGDYFLYNQVREELGAIVGEVWVATYKDQKISSSRKLDIPHFQNKSMHQTGSISWDGRHLLLSMEGTTSYGVEDLYVCHLQPDGSWSAPKNLGYQINTPFQEYTPFLAADGEVLYFSTNGRAGEGSFDIYTANRLDDSWRNWSDPINLGSAVNTSGSETSFTFLPGAEYAYLISTMDSDGYGDIKRIKIKPQEVVLPPTNVTITIEEEVEELGWLYLKPLDARDSSAIEAEVSIAVEDSLFVPKYDGEAYFFQKPLFTEVKVSLKKHGYLDYNQILPVSKDDLSDTLTLVMQPLIKGVTVTLENILFHRGTANFIEGSAKELDLVVSVLNENPNLKILIKGHTDNQGDPVLNRELSEERAKAVRDYIIKKGVDFTRLQSKGYGGNVPIASNASEETRKLNRRVEFEVVEN
ncbi:MAG: OmpA family protein [Cyclobacteriaceae bacterium]|nr:OmpA family protein [Cyclobacteriaceae bacterium HetDA_MAG_MS6]